MSKLNLVVLDIQKSGIKSHGPTDDSGAVRILMKLCQDQPLAYFDQVPGLYIADLETGTIKKPVLKLEI